MSVNSLVVWTRDLDAESGSGRLSILRGVREALSKSGAKREFYQKIAFEYGSITGFLRFFIVLIWGVITFRAIPLQCALYCDLRDFRRRIPIISENRVILDGVRNYFIMREIRHNYPDIKIIVDMDDLMSRRMEMLIDLKEPPTLGLFKARLPGFFSKFLQLRIVYSSILRYERYALKRVELEFCRHCDEIVMVSPKEAKILSERCLKHGLTSFGVTHVIPPVYVPEEYKPFVGVSQDTRFVFVGSDMMVQNRTTIDYLLDLWSKYDVKYRLVIIGRQSRNYGDRHRNVNEVGFVEDMSSVYDGKTVLITPTFLQGGIKTKVMEAFAYAAPVIGNRATYEGLDDEERYVTLDMIGGPIGINRIEEFSEMLSQSAKIGREKVASMYGKDHFIKRWIDIIGR